MRTQLEQLVKENKLEFACNHRTNDKYYLENDKEMFLEYALDDLYWSGDFALRRVYCFCCGQYINYSLEGNKLIPSIADCFDEEEIIIDIPVPSGELMFDDWFEHATPLLAHLDEKTHDINCTKIQVQRAIDYQAIGVGHFFVGGSYPDICQKDGIFYIGNAKYDEPEDEDGDDIEVAVVEGAEILGTVSTGLRWTSVCDYSIYENMAIKKFGNEKGRKMAQEAKEYADLVVNVEPGIYRITYYTKFNNDVELYAKIEKIK